MENNKEASGNQAGTSGEGQTKQEQNVSYESHRKLLSEKKELQEKFQALQSEIEQMKEIKMTEQGRKDELLEQYKNKLKELESNFAQSKKKYVESVVHGTIKSKALEHGCVDPDAVLKIGDFSTVAVDENYQVQGGLEEALNKLKQEKPYLFKQTVKSPDDMPVFNGSAGMQPKSADALSKEDIINRLRNLKQ